jgi:hypothetical protein
MLTLIRSNEHPALFSFFFQIAIINNSILGTLFVHCILLNIPNKHEPNRPLFSSCSSRTELLRTVLRWVPAKHEPNRRSGNFRTMPVFGSISKQTNRTNSNLHCLASYLWANVLINFEICPWLLSAQLPD